MEVSEVRILTEVTIKRMKSTLAGSPRVPVHRESGQGESTAKARPKGVVDGYRVNIPVLGVTAKGGRSRLCWPGDGGPGLSV